MRRHVDAPRKVYLSTAEAARWVGINREIFDSLVAEQKWLKPVMLGAGDKRKSKHWHWMDVVCLCWITSGQRTEDSTSERKPSTKGSQ